MKDQLISFEVAELTKRKGFNLKCYWFCTYNRKVPTNSQSFFPQLGEYKNFNKKDKGFYELFSLPTQSLLQAWLREIHNLNITVDNIWVKGGNRVYASSVKIVSTICRSDVYKTYEEALEKGLYEALKLIENN